ncbi:hypothetical protein OEIGOIKO_03471 [Streptomyces chrestomyceticus JCM 4735]|uniref:Uncharacterized protein n=1 Tax=Streptomyces chrestomyceticus JCM 4735 TaxID=1306181 RepID=A0A7U9PYY7_9ACTN|nr:hypothetical protein OEIGOIKO_03471 [Streptomyces chrestomyceticus JCM 4735]
MPQHQRTLLVGGTAVIVRTSNRTTLGLDVTKAGGIVVRGPHHTTDAEATALVERRRRWIYRQLNHLAETSPTPPYGTSPTGSSSPSSAAGTDSASSPTTH